MAVRNLRESRPAVQAFGLDRGRSLQPAARSQFGQQFGFNFENVRVHTDETAGALARSIHASAFTFGSDVFFAPGKYSPDSGPGRRLLAHELTHVVQQSGAGPGGTIATSEKEAESVATRADTGAPVNVVHRVTPTIACQEETGGESSSAALKRGLEAWLSTHLECGEKRQVKAAQLQDLSESGGRCEMPEAQQKAPGALMAPSAAVAHPLDIPLPILDSPEIPMSEFAPDPEAPPRVIPDLDDFSGLGVVKRFCESLAARRADIVSAAQADKMTRDNQSARDVTAKKEAKQQKLGKAEARGYVQRSRAEVPRVDPGTLRGKLYDDAFAGLKSRWRSALTIRFGRSYTKNHKTIGTFVRDWTSDERERVQVATDLKSDATPKYEYYSNYLKPSANHLDSLHEQARTLYPQGDLKRRRFGDKLYIDGYVDDVVVKGRKGKEEKQTLTFGFGEIEPLAGSGRVAPYTNIFLGALRKRYPGGWHVTTYAGHGAGPWAGAGLCLDFNISSGLDNRGFYPPNRVMELLGAIHATAGELGGDWQGCYDDYSVIDAACHVFAGNKLTYANDARSNNHGPLLLHVHIDLMPPGIIERPPAAAAAGKTEVGR